MPTGERTPFSAFGDRAELTKLGDVKSRPEASAGNPAADGAAEEPMGGRTACCCWCCWRPAACAAAPPRGLLKELELRNEGCETGAAGCDGPDPLDDEEELPAAVGAVEDAPVGAAAGAFDEVGRAGRP